MIGIKIIKICSVLVFTLIISRLNAQIYDDPVHWNRSLQLQTASYYPSALQGFLFHRDPSQFRPFLEAIDFKIVLNTLRLNDVGSEKLLGKFLLEYPNSDAIKRIPYDIATYYFDQGKFRYALKWFSMVNENQVPLKERNRYYFNKGYTLFSAKRYKAAQPLLEKVKSIPEFESNAYYYLGHIAYQLEDYDTANKQFKEVSEENQKEDLAYFQVDMNFRLGRFEQAIQLGKELLKTKRSEDVHSEISKIVGESYFNLTQYAKALPFLEQYKGKKGKWKNIDFYQLGYSYYKAGNYDAAIGQFNKIISGQSALIQSANYYLGDAYLKANQKTAALNAFRSAAAMDFDSDLKEDALLQYAKLSYEIGNPYEDTSSVLIHFLEAYPESDQKQRISSLLVDSYVSSGNYDAALEILENNKSYKNPSVLQKIAYLKAIQTYQTGNYITAISFFEKAVKTNETYSFTASSLYWLGRSLYELNRFDDALEVYKKFRNQAASIKIKDGFRIEYDMAYTYFKLGEYDYALRFFDSFLKQQASLSKAYQYDIQLRMGDCHFALKKYWPAMEHYNEALRFNGKFAAYALYQKGISYGFVDRNTQKIKTLQELVAQFPKSTFTDDAWFELGIAYSAASNFKAALSAYENLQNQFPKSLYVPKAILNQGLILYNQERNLEAQSKLKKLVEVFPKDVVALQAINTLKEIAVDLGQVTAFSRWLKEKNIQNVSDVELEGTAFRAAEKRFLQNDKKQATKLLQEYLNQYPSGANILSAQFYLAEILFEGQAYEEAQPLYKELVDNAPNEFHEKALVRLIGMAQINDDLPANLPLLEKLLEMATFEENKQFAQANLMQVYFTLKQFENALKISKSILYKENLESRLQWDALIIQARSAKALNDTLISTDSYAKLEAHPNGLIAAEALYYRAFKEQEEGNLEASNETIIKIASKQQRSIWSAKALLLLAQNFYMLKDPFQANYILQNLMDTYPEYETIIDNGKELLEKVQVELKKNNASLNDKK